MPQTDILIACSNCGRPAREADVEDLGWRYFSDGVGELHPFCSLCIRREFAPDAAAPADFWVKVTGHRRTV